MMWQTFLKKQETNLIVPPGFTHITSVGANKGLYKIQLKRRPRDWSVITAEGSRVRAATQQEIHTEMRRYPKVHCCFLQTIQDQWLLATGTGIIRALFTPYSVESPAPLTKIVCRNLGGVVLFDNFDFRYTQPWRVDEALELLHKEDLTVDAPTWLEHDQRFAFSIIAENELAGRVPQTETKIKHVLDAEGANLVNMTETHKGYKLRFRYRGRMRDIEVKEDLTLLSSGMCLEGMDNYYSLESFMSILQYEDTGEFGHPIYH